MTPTSMHVPVFAGEGRLVYEDRPLPQPLQPEDVLVEVSKCGICGTDLNILAVPPAHKAAPGLIIGHEAVGRVAAVGAGVSSLQIGDRVVVAPRLTCGKCRYCRRGLDNQCENYQSIGTSRDGAFAPYLLAPERALFKISEQVSDEDAALFEPLSCVVGASLRAPLQPGDRVAILGCGPIGSLFALLYRLQGACQVVMVDVVPYRLEFARSLGADITLHAGEASPIQAVKDLTGIGCDLVVDTVGNQIDTAIRLARRGGQVILFGLRMHDNPPVNQYTITRNDLTLVGTFVGLKPFVRTIQLLESNLLRPARIVTHHVPLAELSRGVELMRSGQAIKVLVENQ